MYMYLYVKSANAVFLEESTRKNGYVNYMCINDSYLRIRYYLPLILLKVFLFY